VELEVWLPALLAEEPAAITIHARTAKEMSKVPARWEFVKRAVEIRNELSSQTLIFGNGDVKDLDEARRHVEETGCDGVMFGRAIFGNPWLFKDSYLPSIEEKLSTLSEHIKLFEELLGHAKNFAIMKKHFKAYVNGFDGASELRHALMEAENATEARKIIENYLKTFKDIV
jgi:tRNA-dihydrouridine synthase